MKKMLSSVAAMATLFSVSATAQEAPAQEENAISVELNTGVATDFVWRGINFTDDAVLQTDITFGYKDWALKVWGNNNLTDENEPSDVSAWQFERVDYQLSYTGQATEDIDYKAGVIRYAFPEEDGAYTTEVFAGASFDTFLNPAITAFYDVDGVNGGLYFLAEASHALEIYKGQDLKLGATLGLGDDKMTNSYYEGTTGTPTNNSGFAFTDLSVSASSDFAVNENVTLTPSLTYTKLLSSFENHDAGSDDAPNENLVAKINLNYVF